MKRNIAAIVLAAGASSRMGKPKQLLRVGSRTLLRRTLEEAIASDVRATFVVLGAEAEMMRLQLADLPVSVLENERWAEGIGSSIAAGVRGVAQERPEFEAAVLMTCDQPHVFTATINRLIDEQETSGKPIVAAGYADTIGVPALFARDYFDALLALPAETGAKALLLRNGDDVAVVEFYAAAIDLDTPGDYDRFASGGGATS